MCNYTIQAGFNKLFIWNEDHPLLSAKFEPPIFWLVELSGFIVSSFHPHCPQYLSYWLFFDRPQTGKVTNVILAGDVNDDDDDDEFLVEEKPKDDLDLKTESMAPDNEVDTLILSRAWVSSNRLDKDNDLESQKLAQMTSFLMESRQWGQFP